MHRLTTSLFAGALALSTGIVGTTAVVTAQQASNQTTAPTEFVGLTPYRTYDTRQTSAEFGKFVAGESGYIEGHRLGPVRNSANEVKFPEEAVAMAFSIQVTDTEGSGFVEIAPCASVDGATSAVAWTASGQRESSSGIVTLDKSTRAGISSQLANCLQIFLDGSADAKAHILVDVTGYFI